MTKLHPTGLRSVSEINVTGRLQENRSTGPPVDSKKTGRPLWPVDSKNTGRPQERPVDRSAEKQVTDELQTRPWNINPTPQNPL